MPHAAIAKRGALTMRKTPAKRINIEPIINPTPWPWRSKVIASHSDPTACPRK